MFFEIKNVLNLYKIGYFHDWMHYCLPFVIGSIVKPGEQEGDSVNDLTNHYAVCRAAPATLSVLNITMVG